MGSDDDNITGDVEDEDVCGEEGDDASGEVVSGDDVRGEVLSGGGVIEGGATRRQMELE